MATVSELTAELLLLKQEKESRQAPLTAPCATAKEPDATPSDCNEWDALLSELGLDNTDPAALLESLTKELDTLARDKPLLTTGAALGLGFVLGRMSK